MEGNAMMRHLEAVCRVQSNRKLATSKIIGAAGNRRGWTIEAVALSFIHTTGYLCRVPTDFQNNAEASSTASVWRKNGNLDFDELETSDVIF